MNCKTKKIIATLLIFFFSMPFTKVLAAQDVTPPVILGTLDVKSTYSAAEDITISTKVTDDTVVEAVKLYYKQAPELPYKSINMTKGKDADTYTASIKHDSIWSRSLTWYVEASDGKNTSKTAEAVSSIVQNCDTSKQPPLLITEVMSNTNYRQTKNRDGMDFIEIYNNSDKAINFGYYKIFYIYPSKTDPLTWIPNKSDVFIAPGKSLVVWIDDNNSSIDAFNQYYKTNLKENEDIVRVNYGGMHENDSRKIIIGHKIDKPICEVNFNTDNKAECTSNPETTINYRYPQDGKVAEMKVSTKELSPSPGKVYDWQVPTARTAHTGYDSIKQTADAPVITPITDAANTDEGKEFQVCTDCSDNSALIGLVLNYRLAGENTFTAVNFSAKATDGHYYALIPSDKLIAKDYLEYYIEASNLSETSKTEIKKVTINRRDSTENLRLNVTDGSVLSGTFKIAAASKPQQNKAVISIDGKTVNTTPSLLAGAYFALSHDEMHGYYKNAIVYKNDVLSLMVGNDPLSKAVYLDNSKFIQNKDGSLEVTVSVYAGTEGSPFESNPSIPNDKYNAYDFRLILADGTVLYADNGIDSLKKYTIEKDKAGLNHLDLHFTVPKDKLTANSYDWNTKAVKDGDHTISVTDGNVSKEIKVKVDNSTPLLDKTKLPVTEDFKRNTSNETPDASSKTTTNVSQPEKASTSNPSAWNPFTVPSQYDFSFAWISDTQYYSKKFPDNFNHMNQWIVDHIKDFNIKYLVHTGDIVDDWKRIYQWQNADNSMKIIDNSGLPYGVLAGNHDCGHSREDYTNYYTYFGEQRFAQRDYYGGSYMDNKGHYDLISAGGVNFIIIYMSWDTYLPEVDWMNKVLAQYPDRKAILCFHRYVNDKGKLDYTGKLVQEQVVKKNPNVFAVLDGHYYGASIKIDKFDDDGDGIAERPVYQICTDYQSAKQGGSEYIKFLYFDIKNNKIYVNSYSPMLDDFNHFKEQDTYENGTQGHDAYVLDVDFGK